MSSDYLRLHPQSRSKLRLDLTLDLDREDNNHISLRGFLRQDKRSTIPHPTSRFHLTWEGKQTETVLHQGPLISDFLENYAQQITHLTISRMTIPLGKHTLDFFEKLPKLQSLSVIHLDVVVDDDGAKVEDLIFPESFRKLRKLKIRSGRESQQKFLWKMIEFCRNLEYYATPDTANFSMLLKILKEGKHKHFKFYDMKRYIPGYSHLYAEENIRELCELSVMSNIKWVNVQSTFFGSLEKAVIKEIAPQVASLRGFSGGENFQEVIFHNVGAIWFDKRFPNDELFIRALEHLADKLFPNVTRVEIAISGFCNVSGGITDLVSSRFPNLEEMRFLDASKKTCNTVFVRENEDSYCRQPKGN